jgi:hypothetical protein
MPHDRGESMSDNVGLYAVYADHGDGLRHDHVDLSYPDALSTLKREFNEKGASLVSIERQA